MCGGAVTTVITRRVQASYCSLRGLAPPLTLLILLLASLNVEAAPPFAVSKLGPDETPADLAQIPIFFPLTSLPLLPHNRRR